MARTPTVKKSRERKLKRPVCLALSMKGIPASPGIAIGEAFLLDREPLQVFKIDLEPDQIEGEIERFKAAVEKTKDEVTSIQEQLAPKVGRDMARIFDAHLMMLKDTMAIDETIDNISAERKNAAYLFARNIERARSTLMATGDRYLRERAVDLQDVEQRVLMNLAGHTEEMLANLKKPCIVLAKYLTPSDTAQLDRNIVLGFATDFGGQTSHASIMARALEMPAVVGLNDVTGKVYSGDPVIVDGTHGTVLINPDEETVREYNQRRAELAENRLKLRSLVDKPARTRDGRAVELQANIELPEEVEGAIAHGARGIGLYRTEYLFLSRSDLPEEEEQYKAYATMAGRIAPDPVVIRTFDLGGDKVVASLGLSPEPNPYLGWRAIRICLDRPDLFRTQLRAAFRASTLGNVRIMFPMISGLAELRQVKGIVRDTQDELRKEQIPFREDCQIGIMIEIPAAALVADRLAREVDFFSIGTNDLIQYTIAVDRGNEKISDLYDPFHPAVLRLIQMVISAGHDNGIWVGLCGEMAGDPLCTWLLLGMGLDEFSMNPVSLPEVKRLIRSITCADAEQIAREALSFGLAKEVRGFLKKQVEERLGTLPLDYASELLWKDYGLPGE